MIISKELSSNDLPSHWLFFSIGRNPKINGSSKSTTLNSNFTVKGPVFLIDFILRQLFIYLGCPIVPIVENDQITSSTVTGDPSENLASFRSLNSTHSRFGPVSMVSANKPYNEKGSSQLRAIKLSTT